MYLPGIAAYASTKYALDALTLTARTEFAADNIRVGVVYPRRTDTHFYQNVLVSGHAQPTRPSVGTTGAAAGVDTAELTAERILEAVPSERAELYMSEAHERQLSGKAA